MADANNPSGADPSKNRSNKGFRSSSGRGGSSKSNCVGSGLIGGNGCGVINGSGRRDPGTTVPGRTSAGAPLSGRASLATTAGTGSAGVGWALCHQRRPARGTATMNARTTGQKIEARLRGQNPGTDRSPSPFRRQSSCARNCRSANTACRLRENSNHGLT